MSKDSDSQKQIRLVYILCHVTTDMCKALADIIIRYNGRYCYHTLYRNCQCFIEDALKALGVKNPTVIGYQGGLSEYLLTLKKGLPRFVYFSNHAELESYLTEKENNGKVNEITQIELEFLLVQYFRFHFEQNRGNELDTNLTCKEPTCCMQHLESHIQFETLIMHKYLKQPMTKDTLGAEERPKDFTDEGSKDSTDRGCEMIGVQDTEQGRAEAAQCYIQAMEEKLAQSHCQIQEMTRHMEERMMKRERRDCSTCSTGEG